MEDTMTARNYKGNSHILFIQIGTLGELNVIVEIRKVP